MNSLDVVQKIQKEFVNEANVAPLLFSDLAQIEQYISETYHNRAFIELLQNADDAKSSRVTFKLFDDFLLVANNGNSFSEADLYSICRSGGSQKKRFSGQTIGYRGIGFKSVVGLCSRVHIFSGDFNVTFCRQMTQKLCSSTAQIPLLRIPHVCNRSISNYMPYTDALRELGYTTFFIFENIDIAKANQEIDNFNSDTLLFLKNISYLEIQGTKKQEFYVERQPPHIFSEISITSSQETLKWLVISDAKDETSVAFLIDSESSLIVPMQDFKKEPVLHSFLPTKEVTGLPCKFNGDFSTDPSRTKIIRDDLSLNIIKQCCLNILVFIDYCIANNVHCDYLKSCLNLLSTISKPISLRSTEPALKVYIYDILSQNTATFNWTFCKSNTSGLPIKPLWFNIKDFNFIFESDFNSYDVDTQELFFKFVYNFTNEEISLSEVLIKGEKSSISQQGSIEILLQFIKQFRFNLDDSSIKLLQSAKILHCERGVLAPKDIITTDKLSPAFIDLLLKSSYSSNDLVWLLEKMKISHIFNPRTEKVESFSTFNNSENNTKKSSSLEKKSNFMIPASSPKLQKWRSAEVNLKLILEQSKNCIVKDVSKQNLGYDLEVIENGEVYFWEIKSVEQFGRPIKITQNEYTTAIQLKEKYCLVLVKQSDSDLQFAQIFSPIESLELDKRVVQWEWFCDSFPELTIETINID